MQNSIILANLEASAIITGIIDLILGGVIAWFILSAIGKSKTQLAKQQGETIISDAKLQAENITKTAQLESKADAIRRRESA